MGKVTVLKSKETPQKMSDDELKRRYQEFKTGKKDFHIAKLFAEARNRGRTQAEISAVVEVKLNYVGKLIRFADFLAWYENNADSTFGTFVPNAEFRPYEVTEGKFRGFWNKRRELKGRENERRRAVLMDLIDHQNIKLTPLPTPPAAPPDTHNELVLLRHSISAIKLRIANLNQDLDAMTQRINRLLPSDESPHQKRLKKFSTQEYKDYINGKIN